MNRFKLARKIIMAYLPFSVFAFLFVGMLVTGPGRMEIWLSHSLWIAIMALIFVIYFFPLFITNDPFWPVRKRLWYEGEFVQIVLLGNEEVVDRSEPFVWSSKPLPSKDVW